MDERGPFIGVSKRGVFSDLLGVYIWQRTGTGYNDTAVVNNLEFEPLAETNDASFVCSLSITAAQKLMDNLWDCGVRPTAGAGSAGAMLATQKHLEDMQKIAYAALKKDGIA